MCVCVRVCVCMCACVCVSTHVCVCVIKAFFTPHTESLDITDDMDSKYNTVEPQWHEHLWNHGNSFKTWVVRATEG